MSLESSELWQAVALVVGVGLCVFALVVAFMTYMLMTSGSGPLFFLDGLRDRRRQRKLEKSLKK